MSLRISIFLFSLFCFANTQAQPDRWQQRAEYVMNIDFDAAKHQFKGTQRLKYFNNSPDTLYKVFYHLYFNAFQPGSMMDMYNRDPQRSDARVGNRIKELKESNYGWHKINSLTCNGKPVKYEVNETILEVTLAEPILPKSSVVFEMDFNTQVPEQIRRSGWKSPEGVEYSMAQWYPKMSEYDYQGWHATPYVQREFYGVWGDFEVNIAIDEKYILGASGILQNPSEIGYGYEPKGSKVNRPKGKLTWKWKAENVHDFAWTADPGYTHTTLERKDGLTLHFLYKQNKDNKENWEKLPKAVDMGFDYMNKHFGQYPYKSYAFLHGGDGGMEYPMATLILGNRNFGSLTGTAIHEMCHAWYYGLLGSNEGLYSWMDEGFTEYASSEIMNLLKKEKIINGEPENNPHASSVAGYQRYLTGAPDAEPPSTHADHHLTARGYSVAAYVVGHVFLTELQYIVGKPAFDKAILRYFDTWKYKHPNPNDVVRIFEKTSGLELDWYKEYRINSTKLTDYAVAAVEKANRKETKITLKRMAPMPMPIDLLVTLKGGDRLTFTIPLSIMRGAKPQEDLSSKYTVLPDWRWTHDTYEFTLDEKFKDLLNVEIDPSRRLGDSDMENNVWDKKGDVKDDED